MTSALALLIAVTSLNAAPLPYTRSKTSKDTAAHCLWWGNTQITYRQSYVGNPATPGETEFVAVQRAFHNWGVASYPCSSVTTTEGQRTTMRKVGRDATGEAQNVVLFRTSACSRKVKSNDACWTAGTCGNTYDCWDHSDKVVGLTTVTYDATAGRITDADIELNAANRYFTTVDSPKCELTLSQSCVADDVQNTMTHEAGHFLGLDHTERSASTMFSVADIGETSKRAIDSGSTNFLCEIYPFGAASRDCVTDTVSESLGEAVSNIDSANGGGGGCTSAPGVFGFAACGAVLALLRRRRRP